MMNGYIKPPKMAMNFSESKSEIKLRSKNIFDNSGKSSGKIILVIIAIIVVLAGVLFAVFSKKTVNLTDKYELGKEVSVDLNGDGTKEKVYYGTDDFRINDVSYKNDIFYMLYENNPMEDYFIIADTDINDNQREIVIRVDGPSNDPEGHFFTFDGERLSYLGSVPSNLDVDDFDGNGNISGDLRLNILQTWWAPAKWELDENRNIVLKEQYVYFPYQPEEGNEIVLLRDLPVHENLNDSSQPKIVSPQKVKITKTDNKQFCYLEAEDGTKGWFMVNDFWKIGELDNISETEVFDNLCMAD